MKSWASLTAVLVFWACAKPTQDPSPEPAPQIDSQQWVQKALDSAHLPMDQRLDYLEQAKKEAFGQTSDSILLQQLSGISWAQRKLQDSLGFRETNNQVQLIAEQTGAYWSLGDSHWDLASFFQRESQLDSAFYHYRKALDSYEMLPDDDSNKSIKARMLYNMGRIQDSFKDYLGAETSIAEALRIFDELGDNRRIYNCYNMLGIISGGIGNNENALEYYDVAGTYIDMLQSDETVELKWENQNNISNVLLRMENYSNAKDSFRALYNNPEIELKDPNLFALIMTSLAYASHKSGRGNPNEIESLFEDAMVLNDELGREYNQARTKQYYAEFLLAQGDTLGALENALEARDLAQETHNNERSLEVLRLLTRLDGEHAASYADEYYALNEAIKLEEMTKRDKFARIRMETDEIKQRNVLLSQEKQKWAGAVMGISILGFTLLIIAIQFTVNNRLKSKQKQQENNQEIYNLLLSQQGKFEEGRQLEQKRISEELHDGVLGEMLGIRLILSGLNEREDEDSVERRAEYLEKLRDVEEEIRTISHVLNDASYQNFHNFIVSLEHLAQGTEKGSGIKCTLNYDNKVNWDRLHGEIKINSYRIVQESLKNCVKHAKCQHIEISFLSFEDKLKLTIKDDGVGFDINKGKRGIGLRNIISRVKKLDGTFDMHSAPGKGTTLWVLIPMAYSEPEGSGGGQERKQAINA